MLSKHGLVANKISVMRSLALAIGCSISTLGYGQIVTDGSMGAQLNLNGPNYRIGQDLGNLVGNNLFHSFEVFSLSSGESAVFTGANSIENVIGRVTGTQASLIQGLLKSEIGNADLYLINPNGVIFGEGAKVDVPGSFYVSTANSVGFSDGSQFSASNTATSSLTVATPESFGFLGNQSGDIVFQGTDLNLKNGGYSHFSAANVRVNNARIVQSGGGLTLFAIGGQGATLDINAPQLLGNGELSFNDAELKVEGEGYNQLSMLANQIGFQDSFVSVLNRGSSQNTGGLSIGAGDIELGNSLLSVATKGDGSSGNIDINAQNLSMRGNAEAGGSEISIESRSQSGAAGQLNIEIENKLSLVNESRISNATRHAGEGGSIFIKAGQLIVDTGNSANHAEIATFTGGDADAGDIHIEVSEDLSLIGNAQVNASTLGNGNAGDININASNLTITETEPEPSNQSNVGIQSLSGLQTDINNAPQGNSGNINLDISGALNIKDGGQIVSVTVGDGDAGNIQINAGSLTLEGTRNSSGSVIGSNTLGPNATGDAGNINIEVDSRIEMLGASLITTTAVSAGNAGDLDIVAGSLLMQGGQGTSSNINSATFGPNANGNAGDISIQVQGAVELMDGASISSDTENNGNAGNIFITAASLSMTSEPGQDREDTGISSSAQSEDDMVPSSGNAGNIELAIAGDILLQGDVSIATEGESRGNAGNIKIQADNLFLRGGELESKSEGESFKAGNAGEIDINLTGTLEMVGGAAIASDSFNGGDAGDININANALIMNGFGRKGEFSAITSTAAWGESNSGNITINVDTVIGMQDGANIISDSILAGRAGTINISAQSLHLDGNGLPTRISSASIDSKGDAGEINIVASEAIELLNGGQITSSTLGGSGSAGQVNITTNNLTIDAENSFSLEQYLGFLRRQLAEEFDEVPDEFEELPELDDDLILLSAYIDVQLGGLLDTGITSNSSFASTGDAGVINVDAQTINIKNGGIISTTTDTAGKAGDIVIATQDLDILQDDFLQGPRRAGIFSNVSQLGSGQAGTVGILASGDVNLSGGVIAVDSRSETSGDAEAVGNITIAADNITVEKGANITSQSRGNTPASNITLSVNNQFTLQGAQITTSAQNANAGAIQLTAKEIFVSDSIITTSVSGSGDGGNIDIASDFILLDTGFIQGNTGGEDFSGGDINIGSDFLIVKNQQLITSSDTRQQFQPGSGTSVIQAAAPDGVSGTVDIGALEFDLSGELASFNSDVLEQDLLSEDPCNTSSGSSLGQFGRGSEPAQLGTGESRALSLEQIKQRLGQVQSSNVGTSASNNLLAQRHCQSKDGLN